MTRRRLFFLTLVPLLLAGCGGRAETDYMPAADAARQAVQTALDAWKSGKPYAPITESKPAVHVYEARWQHGQKLKSFTIGEPAAGEKPPRFPVKMQLEGGAEETVNYVVNGIDPLNVWNEADLKRATGL